MRICTQIDIQQISLEINREKETNQRHKESDLNVLNNIKSSEYFTSIKQKVLYMENQEV
jgi:hypothetical protein